MTMRSPISTLVVYLIVLLAAGMAVAAALAQPRTTGPSMPSAAAGYDYVGVGASLVRIDRDTGRIEILEQRDSPGMNLAIEQNRPWTWRRIRVDERPDKSARRNEDRPQGFGGRDGENGDE